MINSVKKSKAKNLEFQDWWLNQLSDLYDKIKFDGIWIDMNEPANFIAGTVGGCEEEP